MSETGAVQRERQERSNRPGRTLRLLTSPVRGRGIYSRSRVLQTLYREAVRRTGPHVVEVNGQQIELDAFDACRLLIHRGYEPHETTWYEQFVRPGDFVVEVGAHIGIFATQLASLVGPSGRVISYEPDPVTAELLRRNIARNSHANVEVVQSAVGAAPARARFYRSKENSGDNRLFSHGSGDQDCFEVEVQSLDERADSWPRIDLLKIDVQGAEPLVFAGLAATMVHRPPRRVLFEFWPFGIVGLDGDPEALLRQLVEWGYGLEEMSRDTGALSPLDPHELCTRLTLTSEEWVNVVAVHRTADDAATDRPDVP